MEELKHSNISEQYCMDRDGNLTITFPDRLIVLQQLFFLKQNLLYTKTLLLLCYNTTAILYERC